MVRELFFPVGHRYKIFKRINKLKSNLSSNAQVIIIVLCFQWVII